MTTSVADPHEARSPAVAPVKAARMGFLPAINGFRGICVSMVFLHHVTNSGLPPMPDPNSFWEVMLYQYGMTFGYGVELFFMISGFVIVMSLRRHSTVRAFLVDRAIRILPVWLPVVALLYVAARFFHRPAIDITSLPKGVLVAIANVALIPPLIPLPQLHPASWSLTYEMVFYAVSGLCVFLWRRNEKFHPAHLLLLIGTLLLLAMFPRSIFFLPGVFVVLMPNASRLFHVVPRLLWLTLPLFLISWYQTGIIAAEYKYPLWQVIAAGDTLLVLIALLAATHVFVSVACAQPGESWLLESRAVQFVGTISYSFYLIHPLVMGVVKAGVRQVVSPAQNPWLAVAMFAIGSAIVSGFLSYLSWRYLEQSLARWLRSLHERSPASSVDQKKVTASQTAEAVSRSATEARNVDALAAKRAALRFSVVIPNYNYEAYVGDAIRSALALDWPSVEVIVVDDGSVDGSRAVISSFASRITSVFQENLGQVGACNAGFAIATGDLVIFLDSDDLLDPEVAREAAGVWEPGVSKVQFQMRSVDAGLKPLGTFFPQYGGTPTPTEIRRWVSTTSAYPTPPGSGNVYTRDFLTKIFPLTLAGGAAADSCCIAAAPFLGDVVTVPKALVRYRIHGKNDGAFSELDTRRFAREINRATSLFAYGIDVARKAGIDVRAGAIRYSLTLFPYRVASYRFHPEAHPFDFDTRWVLLKDLFGGLRKPQGLPVRNATTIAVWSLIVLCVPLVIARRLILWRFVPVSRPQVLRRALQTFGVIRGHT